MLIALGVVLLAATALPEAGAQVAAVPPSITTVGTRFVDGTGGTVVLRGVNAYPSTSASTVLAAGANFVRVYLRWSDLEPSAPVDGLHAWSPTALAQIDSLVGALRDAGVQVLLDVHQCGWSPYWASITSGCSNGIPAWVYADGRFPATGSGRAAARAAWWTSEADRSKAAYVPFLQMLVSRYAAYENVIGYELINEPAPGSLGATTETTNSILRWQAAMIPVVRELDPWRAIVVMGRGGGEGIGTADLSLLGSDPHLVLDWHDYYNGRTGSGFDAAGDEWVPSWSATHMQDTTTYDGTLAQQWQVIRVPVAKTAAAGMPLLIGEWGVRKDTVNADVYQSHMLGLFEDLGLSWSRWVLSTTDSMGIRASGGGLAPAGIQLRDYLNGPTGKVPNDLPPVPQSPTIEGGAPMVGRAVTAITGEWARRPYVFAYRWERCEAGIDCVPIAGASGPAYTVSSDDLGARLRLTVVGINLWGMSDPVSSALTDPVIEGPPVNTTLPAIIGTPTIGSSVVVSPGAWAPAPSSYDYRWQRCTTTCADIEGATGASYLVGDADVGAKLQVTVIAYGGGTASLPAASPQTTTVPLPLPLDLTLPMINGSAKVGVTLTATVGTWKYAASFAYQWQRCGSSCSAITGAKYATYTPTTTDLGKTIRLKVTGRNATGSVTAFSAKTATVVK